MKTPEEIKKGLAEAIGEAGWVVEGGDAHDLIDACEKAHASMADALAYIQQLEAKVPKWISVEDRLPDEENCYLIIMANGFITTEIWLGRQWGLVACGEEVTHWMPLPEPPKEDESHATD